MLPQKNKAQESLEPAPTKAYQLLQTTDVCTGKLSVECDKKTTIFCQKQIFAL